MSINLRNIQNCAARLILKNNNNKTTTTSVNLTTASLLCFSLSTGSIAPLFQSRHWLLIQHGIQYKINTLSYKRVTRPAPSYLSDCLQLYTPSRTVRSASETLNLQIPRTRLSTTGARAFSVFGPSTWSDLPLPLRQKPFLDSFKSNLKHFCLQNDRPTMFSTPRCCLPPHQVPVCYLFKLAVN